MHYHLEILMPPTNDIEGAVTKILAPFDESAEGEDASGHGFWDWWQLGGRYSGSKITAAAGSERVEAFRAELIRLGVTVSGLQWGKQELTPADQIPAVDALWREMCPGAGEVCPLFKHSGNSMGLDNCTLEALSKNLMAHSFIAAAPDYNDELAAETLLHKSIWNGCTHQDTTWKGSVVEAVAKHGVCVERYREEYRENRLPKPDWLVVTVDYHS